MLLFHEVCHSSKIYLLIDGLKLENGILKDTYLLAHLFAFIIVMCETICTAGIMIWQMNIFCQHVAINLDFLQ